MKSTKILSGKFANAEGQKGNFTGYNSAGERIFIHKSQMESIKMKTDADFKPFFALTDEKDIQTRDAEGELTAITVKRLQALSVFLTLDELMSAENSDFELKIASKKYQSKLASTSGLSEAQVNALLEVSI
jgi:hypothetical protein